MAKQMDPEEAQRAAEKKKIKDERKKLKEEQNFKHTKKLKFLSNKRTKLKS